MEHLSGTIEEIIFRNDENGYCVCDMNVQDSMVTLVGYLPFVVPGEIIDVEGEFINHPTYGKQFSVSAFSKTPPNSIEAIYKYLAAGMIKGIGPSTAQKIVETFGEDSLNVIESDPERLAELKGISIKRAIEISNSYQSQFGVRNIIMFLQQNNISPVYAGKIYKQFGGSAIELIQNNPYILAREIQGIGFKTADKIAQGLGVHTDNPERVKAAVIFILQEATTNGHVYLPRYTLLSRTIQLTECDGEAADIAVSELCMEHYLIREEHEGFEAVYLAGMYMAETGVAEKLRELNNIPPKSVTPALEKLVDKVADRIGIQLEEKQRRAAITAMTTPVVVITGGPGTGKTTVINTIIQTMEADGKTVLLAAPTGRAAKRMTEVTNHEACTLHRLLEAEYSREEHRTKFARHEASPLEADAVIVDEMSMVDILLCNALLKAIPHGTSLILVGDADQLPSVGPGNVLRDIIKSEGVLTIRLTEIFRQARESMIVINAHRINSGQFPVLNQKDKDFFLMNRNSPEKVVETIVELCKYRLPKAYKVNPYTDIQVLTPMRKNAVGVNVLNDALQQALNPADEQKNEKKFGEYLYREGDKVMQIKNNYDIPWESSDPLNPEGQGLFNGDMGIIKAIDNRNEEMTIVFDEDKTVTYHFSSLMELEPAFATTVHKSQGSEFPIIIMPVFSGNTMMQSRNLLYTAVTRAKQLVILVGQETVLSQMIENNNEFRRYSGLQERLTYDS